MPGMNGTGPEGAGPRTGWGMGRCRPPKKDSNDDTQAESAEVESDEAQPGPVLGQGRGWWRDRGGGRGRGGRRGRGWGPGRGQRMRRGFGGGGGRSAD